MSQKSLKQHVRRSRFETLEDRSLLSVTAAALAHVAPVGPPAPAPALVMSVHPDTLVESTSAKPGYGVVSLNSGLAKADLVVTLASSDTGEATVPTTVTIPKGYRSATFQVTPVPDTTADDAQTVTLTASATGYANGTASVQVIDPAIKVAIFPKSIVESADAKPAQGIVSLNTGPVSADTVVTLTSSDTNEATVPATVTIPKGYSWATFTITPVVDTTPDAAQTVTVTATADGYLAGTANVQVVDPTVNVKIISQNVVEGGAKPGYGIVSLNTGPATADTVVTLTSSDTSEATVPATVTIPKGYSWAQFAITGVPDTTPDGPQTVTISAAATGFEGGTANVQVVDPGLVVKILTQNISEAAGARPGYGIVYLNSGPAAADTVITLASDNTGEATVPATVTILKGRQWVAFQITAVPDTTADGTQVVNITASASGFTNGSGSVNLVDSLPGKTARSWASLRLAAIDAFFHSFEKNE
jgi:hypothetical protein